MQALNQEADLIQGSYRQPAGSLLAAACCCRGAACRCHYRCRALGGGVQKWPHGHSTGPDGGRDLYGRDFHDGFLEA